MDKVEVGDTIVTNLNEQATVHRVYDNGQYLVLGTLKGSSVIKIIKHGTTTRD